MFSCLFIGLFFVLFFFYCASNLWLPVLVSRTFFAAHGLDDSFGLQKWNTNVPVFKTGDVCFCYVFGQSQVPVKKDILLINTKYGLFICYRMTVSLRRVEDFDSFVEREFEITNLQVEFEVLTFICTVTDITRIYFVQVRFVCFLKCLCSLIWY